MEAPVVERPAETQPETRLKFWPTSNGIHIVEVSSCGDIRLVGWLWIAAA